MRIRLAFVYLSISMCVLFIAAAPPQEPPISTAEAAANLGKIRTVCGRVATTRWVRDTPRQPTFLNFDRGYPNQTLAIVIWPEARKKFTFPPEEKFRGKRICVRGKIRQHDEKPEIEVEEPSQVWIAEGQ